MEDAAELESFLMEARRFLEDRWRDRAIELELSPSVLSTDMCGFSCGFLLRTLPSAIGGAWSVRGGIPMSETGKRLPSGGILGSDDVWHGHYWLHDAERGVIVDLTADQFGHAAIVVLPEDDARYDANYDVTEIEDQMRAVGWRVSQWCGAWARRTDQRPEDFSTTARGV